MCYNHQVIISMITHLKLFAECAASNLHEENKKEPYCHLREKECHKRRLHTQNKIMDVRKLSEKDHFKTYSNQTQKIYKDLTKN